MRKCKFFHPAVAGACFTVVVLPLSIARADSATASAPSTYQTINVTGDASQFDNIPVAASNSPDTNAAVDPVQLKICNDSTSLYVQITFATQANPQSGSGLYTAIDSDNDPTTGYHVFGSANIGSNTAFENDFPFTQAGNSTSQNFNSGGTITSPSSTAAGTNIYQASPYNVPTLTQIISLPLDLTQVDSSTGGYTGAVLPQGQLFSIEFYTDPSSGDAVVLGTATYELATVADTPEPASLGVIAFGGLLLGRRRRKA